MSNLKTNLQRILAEKQAKIKPENIKSGITIFDIEGILEAGSGGGSGDVKLFSNTDAMQADENMELGGLAIIYGSKLGNMTTASQVESITFPATVVLPEAITTSTSIRLRANTSYTYSYGTLTSTSFSIDATLDSGDVYNITYTSEDGITYTRTDTNAETIDFGETIKVYSSSYWTDYAGYFMQVLNMELGSLYKCTSYSDSTKYLLYNFKDNDVQQPTVVDEISNTDITNVMTLVKANNISSVTSSGSVTLAKRADGLFEVYYTASSTSANYQYKVMLDGVLHIGFTSSSATSTLTMYKYIVDVENQTVTSSTETPTSYQMTLNDTTNTTYVHVYPSVLDILGFTTVRFSYTSLYSSSVSAFEANTETNVVMNYGSDVTVSYGTSLHYTIAPNQLTLTSSYSLLPGVVALGKNSVITGAEDFFTQTFTPEQVSQVAGIDYENQTNYPIYNISSNSHRLRKIIPSDIDPYNTDKTYAITTVSKPTVYVDPNKEASPSVSYVNRGATYNAVWYVIQYSTGSTLLFYKSTTVEICKWVTLPQTAGQHVSLMMYNNQLYMFLVLSDNTYGYLYKVNDDNTFTQIMKSTGGSGYTVRFVGCHGAYMYYRHISGAYTYLYKVTLSSGSSSRVFWTGSSTAKTSYYYTSFIFSDRTFYLYSDTYIDTYGNARTGLWGWEITESGSFYKYDWNVYPAYYTKAWVTKESGKYYLYVRDTTGTASTVKAKRQLSTGSLGGISSHTKNLEIDITGQSSPKYIIYDGTCYTDIFYSNGYKQRYDYDNDSTLSTISFPTVNSSNYFATYFNNQLIQVNGPSKMIHIISPAFCEINNTSDEPGDIIFRKSTNKILDEEYGYGQDYCNLSDCLLELNERNETITTKTEEIASLEQTITEQETTITEKEATIVELETNYDTCNALAGQILGETPVDYTNPYITVENTIDIKSSNMSVNDDTLIIE